MLVLHARRTLDVETAVDLTAETFAIALTSRTPRFLSQRPDPQGSGAVSRIHALRSATPGGDLICSQVWLIARTVLPCFPSKNLPWSG